MYYIAIYENNFGNEYTVFGETIQECILKLEMTSSDMVIIFNNIRFFEAKQIKVIQEYIIE